MAEGVEFAPANIEALLQQRRLEILTLIADHGDKGRPVELGRTRIGQLSRMDALQSQAMAKATERRRQQELLRIEQALKRLADGQYGECLECGKPIAQKRLAFDPSAALCIDCAGKDEG